MATNVAEHASFNPPVVQSAVVQTVNENNMFLQMLPVIDITSDRYEWWLDTTEDDTVGGRQINSTFSEGSASINKQVTHLSHYGGYLDIDEVLYNTDTNGLTAQKLRNKLNSLGLKVTDDIFQGNQTTTPEQCEGINRLIAQSNEYYIGPTAAGVELVDSTSFATASDRAKAVGVGVNYAAAGVQMNSAANRLLLLQQLDIGIARMPVKPDAIICGSGVKVILKQALNESGIVRTTIERFGENVELYDGIPIITLPKYSTGLDILDFDELSPDGTTNNDCASLYLIKFGTDNYFHGVRGRNIQVGEPMLKEDQVTYRISVKMDFAPVMKKYDCVYRIGGIRR